MRKIDEILAAELSRQKNEAEELRRQKETAIMEAIGPAWDEVSVKPGRSFGFSDYDLTIVAPGYVPIYAIADLRDDGPVRVRFFVRHFFWPVNSDYYCRDFSHALVAAKK